MDRVDLSSTPTDLGESSRLKLERAENSDDATRLKTLDELYETLEAELAEDTPPRS